jgi:uncharacterized membrane protein YdbT with pleckstrin-like domain
MSETAQPAGELITYQGKLHWSVFVRPVMFSCLAALLFSNGEPFYGAAATLAAGLFWGAALMAAWGSVFVITERRVLVRAGTIFRVNLNLPLDQVERVEVRQDTMGRLLGYGTLLVDGHDGSRVVCPGLAHAAEFQRQLQAARGA